MAEIQTLTNNLSRALACSPSDDSDLRLWGGKIFDRIIPQQLSDTFRQDARSSYLVLYLIGFSWIPWELLWDGEEFLCRRFRLSRLLQSLVLSCEGRRTPQRGAIRPWARCLFGVMFGPGCKRRESRCRRESQIDLWHQPLVLYCP